MNNHPDKRNSLNIISLLVIAVILILVIAAAKLFYDKFAADTAPGLTAMDGNSVTDHGTDANTGENSDNSGSSAEKGEADSSQTQQPRKAPDFTVEDLEGNKYKLSDFRGKPVIINFWASWCGPCKMEMPDFEELYNEYGDKIHFLMVNMTDGYQETKAKALSHIESEGYTFPVYYDTATEAAYAYGISSIPATFFIDAEGYPVVYGVGALDKETLLTGIEMFPEFQ